MATGQEVLGLVLYLTSLMYFKNEAKIFKATYLYKHIRKKINKKGLLIIFMRFEDFSEGFQLEKIVFGILLH